MRVACARGCNVFRCFDDWNKHGGILRQSDLCAAGRVGANRLHPEPVRQNAMMANLIDLRLRQFQSWRKLTDLVSEVGETDELIRGHEMMHAITELLRT